MPPGKPGTHNHTTFTTSATAPRPTLGVCEWPVSAIFMGKDYELAVYSKDDFIWDKSDLLVKPAADAKLPAMAG